MTQEPEEQKPDKLPNSSLEKKIFGIEVSEIAKILRLVSSGITIPVILESLSKGELTKTAIFCVIFVVMAFWGFIRESFLDTLINGFKKILKNRAERYVQTIEQQDEIFAEKALQNAAREAEQKLLNDFESRYLEEQKYSCHRDDVDGVREEENLDNYPVLNEIFVPLLLIDHSREAGFNPYQEMEDGQTSDIWQLLKNSQGREKLKRISIRAWGGYGKTTLLKYLAYAYSNGDYKDNKAPKFIPFLLYLSRCVKPITQDDSLKLSQLLTDHAHKLTVR